jgi:uncharacterized protein YbaR (Trm112 family)
MSTESPQPDSSRRASLLASIVDQLACPACQAAMRLDVTALQCTGCSRLYPIVDGIPVLIADETERE